MAQIQFNAEGVEPIKPLEFIPDGEYTGVIANTQIQAQQNDPTKSQLQVTFQITDGEYAGRQMFDNLQMWSDNPKAVDMARRKMSGIIHAVQNQLGRLTINDTSELHGLTLNFHVKTTVDRNDTHPDPNQRKRYSNIDQYFPVRQITAVNTTVPANWAGDQNGAPPQPQQAPATPQPPAQPAYAQPQPPQQATAAPVQTPGPWGNQPPQQ